MPTYCHKESGKRFLFVHIPRTGGRFVESNLELNGFKSEENIWDTVDGVEIAHLDRSLYEKHFDIDNIPHICIVRNPVDRFFSASIYLRRMYGENVGEIMEDEMMFYSMLDNFPFPEAVNWFRPQVDFLSDKTHIWKLEDRLNSKFSEWMSGILGIPFKIDAFAQYDTNSDEGVGKIARSDKLIDNVRKLYRRDYEQLYPELDPSLQEGEKAKT